MTVAVCVKCGSLKHGAFNSCTACSFRPIQDIDLAYSLALTDHYLAQETLERISANMKSGEARPSLPPDREREFLKMVTEPQLRKLMGFPARTDESSS